jgi:hypothetical protein
MEPIFWKPDGTPREDSYYQHIEEWVTAKLEITWDAPRPSFLYETDALHLRPVLSDVCGQTPKSHNKPTLPVWLFQSL